MLYQLEPRPGSTLPPFPSLLFLPGHSATRMRLHSEPCPGSSRSPSRPHSLHNNSSIKGTHPAYQRRSTIGNGQKGLKRTGTAARIALTASSACPTLSNISQLLFHREVNRPRYLGHTISLSLTLSLSLSLILSHWSVSQFVVHLRFLLYLARQPYDAPAC